MPEDLDNKIKIERSPTPEGEAAQFANKDEARLREQANRHELDLLRAKQGKVGGWTGSANDTLNVALIILVPLFVLVLLFGMMSAAYPTVYTSIIDGLLKVISLIVGVGIGAATKGKD